jgi:nicotinate-nucleotide pyrophosphorylase (carboxylating)
MAAASRAARPRRGGYRALARAALREDRADRDRTTRAALRGSVPVRAVILAQAAGVLSGSAAAREVARAGGLRVRARAADGRAVRPGQVVLELAGDARRVLAVERSLLNLLMHASGVATATSRAVRAARGARRPLEIWATRKTLPGLRDLEKAAVVDGGGHPHRRDLADGFLLKSTHLALVPLETAILRLRARAGERIEVEVRSPSEAVRAARAGADALLIDNARPSRARSIVRALEAAGLRDGRWIELSGGITPGTVRRYRTVGADAVSLGALTHSAPALPFHLRLEPVRLSRPRP